MRHLRTLALALALVCVTLSSAWAQETGTVTIVVGNALWKNRPPTDQLTTNVNRADCLAPDVSIEFNVQVTGAISSKVLEAWSGSDCGLQINRNNNTNCVKAYSGTAKTGTVSVLVKDILQKSGDENAGIGTGSDATCDDAGGSAEGTNRVLWFLVLDPSSLMTAAAQAQWPFRFDVTPPGAPVDAVAGPGEESLIVSFSSPGDIDLSKYRVYCSDDEGGCSSSILVGGEDPPAGQADCGNTNATGTTQITAKNLANGISYAVAVSSEDKLGNIGKMSNLTCGVPQAVTGFYEAYRAAGGEGGGGFCAFAPARRGGAFALMLALAASAAWLRRRR